MDRRQHPDELQGRIPTPMNLTKTGNRFTSTTLVVKAVAIETVPNPTSAIAGERWKTAFDFTAAIVLMVPCLPVMWLAMLLTRLTSHGPGMYSQIRMGQFGKPFTIYKIRTMRIDAEKDGKPQWSTPGDTRITRLGVVLRALHIDELPQLWNVLKGEMSLVGPRPERPEIAANLRKEIHGYDRRLEVKPGITGYAQIHLSPDETIECVRLKLAYDRYYIRHASPMRDLSILLCTVLKVLGLRKLYRR